MWDSYMLGTHEKADRQSEKPGEAFFTGNFGSVKVIRKQQNATTSRSGRSCVPAGSTSSTSERYDQNEVDMTFFSKVGLSPSLCAPPVVPSKKANNNK